MRKMRYIKQIKPVNQTRFGLDTSNKKELGNCFAACVASFLGLETEEIPQVQEEFQNSNWFTEIESFLSYRTVQMFEYNKKQNKSCPYLAMGVTDRGTYHSCIYKGSKLLHDPCGGNGLDKILEKHVFAIIF